MTSLERNKKLYEHLVSFTDSNLNANELNDEIPKEDPKSLQDIEKHNNTFERIGYIDKLLDLKYIKVDRFTDYKTNKKYAVIKITESGWKFIQYHEDGLNNQLQNTRQTALQTNMNVLTLILAVASAGLLIFEILKWYLSCPCRK